jgi:hypothetical protein
MTTMTHSKSFLVLAIVLGVAGCHETPLVTVNTEPEAVACFVRDGECLNDDILAAQKAKISDKDPKREEKLKAIDQKKFFPFDGQDISVQLDSKLSSDEDGSIDKVEWKSGNLDPDAGVRTGPDPGTKAKPKVTVGEGTWRFVLWVTDNKGKVSKPSTVEFVVGKPPATSDPKVAACVADVIPTVPASCAECVCALSDDCRSAVTKDVCAEDCWGLIQCIGQKCPTFSMDMDTQCVITNCMDFLTGSAGAMAAGTCVVMCIDSCPAMMSADMDAGM